MRKVVKKKFWFARANLSSWVFLVGCGYSVTLSCKNGQEIVDKIPYITRF